MCFLYFTDDSFYHPGSQVASVVRDEVYKELGSHSFELKKVDRRLF